MSEQLTRENRGSRVSQHDRQRTSNAFETKEQAEVDEDYINVIDDLGYNRTTIYTVMMMIFSFNLLANLDHGALPASVTAISMEYKMKDVALGALGSLVFIGNAIGGILVSLVVNRVSSQTLIAVALLIDGIGLILFAATANFYFMAASRFFSGLS